MGGAAARRSAEGGAGPGESVGWSRPRCVRILLTTGPDVFVQERIEGATVTVMPWLRAGDVVGNRLLALGHLHDSASGNEEEHRFGVNESVDQPWTRDAVHARLFSGHPFHRCLPSVGWIGISIGSLLGILRDREVVEGLSGLGPGVRPTRSGAHDLARAVEAKHAP